MPKDDQRSWLLIGTRVVRASTREVAGLRGWEGAANMSLKKKVRKGGGKQHLGS